MRSRRTRPTHLTNFPLPSTDARAGEEERIRSVRGAQEAASLLFRSSRSFARSLALAVMINTYHTSLPPPPIPPRPGHRQPPSGHSTPFLWFLSVIMVLQMGVTFGGFIYLFRKTNMLQSEFLRRGYDDLVVLKRLQDCHEGSLDSNSLLDCGKILEKYKAIMSKVSQVSGKANFLTGSAPFDHSGAVAHMVPERPGKSSQSTGKTLRWNKEHSLLVQVTYMSTPGALSINVPGDYYIYSQVTFSKTHPKAPLSQCIVQRKASMADEKVLLRTFASLKGENQPSTSFQGGVFRLEMNDQLWVNVTDMSLITSEVASTTFGLFML